MTTAIRERSVVDLATVKSYLGVTGTSDDALLTLWLAAAKRAADDYCINPFTDADGEEEAIAEPVELGILDYVGWHYMSRRRGKNVTEEKVGDLSVKYAVFATVPDMLAWVQATWWAPYRLWPGC